MAEQRKFNLIEQLHSYLQLPQKRKVLLNPRWWSVLLRKQILPPSVTQYLQLSNLRLQELSSRYAEARLFDNSFWKAKKINLLNFRGEWNYLDQLAYSISPQLLRHTRKS